MFHKKTMCSVYKNSKISQDTKFNVINKSKKIKRFKNVRI